MTTKRKRRPKWTPEQHAAIWADLDAGLSIRAIASKMDVGGDCIANVCSGHSCADYYAKLDPELIARVKAKIANRRCAPLRPPMETTRRPMVMFLVPK